MTFKDITKAKTELDARVDAVNDQAEAQNLTADLFAEAVGVK